MIGCFVNMCELGLMLEEKREKKKSVSLSHSTKTPMYQG